MDRWFERASATFAGGAVAIALVAMPTYVWLPREFDELRTQLSELSNSQGDLVKVQSGISDSIVAIQSGVTTIDQDFKDLVAAIASADAESVWVEDSNIFAGQYGAATSAVMTAMLPAREPFLSLLPADLRMEMVEGDPSTALPTQSLIIKTGFLSRHPNLIILNRNNSATFFLYSNVKT